MALAQNRGGRTARGTYLLSGIAVCSSCGRNLGGSTLGRKPRWENGSPPPRIYKCANRECDTKPTIMVDRLDKEVTEQFLDHLAVFRIEAVDDQTRDLRLGEVRRSLARWNRAVPRGKIA